MKIIGERDSFKCPVTVYLLNIRSHGQILNDRGEDVIERAKRDIEEFYYHRPECITVTRRNLEREFEYKDAYVRYVVEDRPGDQIRVTMSQPTGEVVIDFKLSFGLNYILKMLNKK